jgi:hypothetical protein
MTLGRGTPVGQATFPAGLGVTEQGLTGLVGYATVQNQLLSKDYWTKRITKQEQKQPKEIFCWYWKTT